MKLIFDKKSDTEINIRLQEGTVPVDFSYIKMAKQLLQDKKIEEPDYNGLNDEEKEKLKDMLDKISKIFI